MSKNRAVGEQAYWNPFEKEQSIKRKRYFVIKLLHGALCGLAYMHDHDRLHQSLGPASVVLKYGFTFFLFFQNTFFIEHPSSYCLLMQYSGRERGPLPSSAAPGSSLFS